MKVATKLLLKTKKVLSNWHFFCFPKNDKIKLGDEENGIIRYLWWTRKKREIKEEIGISIDSSDATFVAVVPFKMDRVKDDGSLFKDRAFANVYVDLYEGNYQDFALDKEEVLSLVLVDAKEALELFKKETGSIKGLEITYDNKKIEKEIAFSEFLVNDGETAFEKYGQILAKIIEITQTR